MDAFCDVASTVYAERVFVKLRELLASNMGLARKLATLERSLIAMDVKTQRRFQEVYDAIRVLMGDTPPKQRPIGFTANLEEAPWQRGRRPGHFDLAIGRYAGTAAGLEPEYVCGLLKIGARAPHA